MAVMRRLLAEQPVTFVFHAIPLIPAPFTVMFVDPCPFPWIVPVLHGMESVEVHVELPAGITRVYPSEEINDTQAFTWSIQEDEAAVYTLPTTPHAA